MPASFLDPFILGTPEQFAHARHLLLSAGYTEQAVCQHSSIASIFDFELNRDGAYEPKPFTDRFELLLRLLMHGHVGSEADILAVLSAGEIALFEELGILARREDDASLLYATAALYPLENVFVASDRTFAPAPHWKTGVPSDVVFAAITRHTRTFLGSIPRDRCDRFLDLCAGSGVAALLAGANFAHHACAADLGARCVHFAEFSRRLNGLDNVTSAQGDLYAAVAGQQFDRIVAHPPFIPSKTQSVLFRDGGEDGEQIFRRVIEGLPDMLAPGGRLHCVTYSTDRKAGHIEDRIRTWLGPAESDFDIVLVASELHDRSKPHTTNLVKAAQDRDFIEFEQALDEMGVMRQFHGSVMLQRKPAHRKAFSARIVRSRRTPLNAVEQYRTLVSRLYALETAHEISQVRPTLPVDFQLIVTHRPGPEGFIPTGYVMKTAEPWVAEAETEAPVAALLSRCDGNRTLSDLYSGLLADGIIAEGTTPGHFWIMLRLLATHGFVLLGSI